MQTFWNVLYSALGLTSEPKDLTFSQVTLRGVIVFFAALIIVRLGDRRSLAQKSAFDLAFIVIVGSVLARAINGSGPFFGTLLVSFVIVMLHRFLAWVCYRWPRLNAVTKGNPIILLRDGTYQRANMKACLISEMDFEEDMRLSELEDKSKVHIARLEPSGDVSFIKVKEKAAS